MIWVNIATNEWIQVGPNCWKIFQQNIVVRKGGYKDQKDSFLSSTTRSPLFMEQYSFLYSNCEQIKLQYNG